jgi:hypothetical protein
MPPASARLSSFIPVQYDMPFRGYAPLGIARHRLKSFAQAAQILETVCCDSKPKSLIAAIELNQSHATVFGDGGCGDPVGHKLNRVFHLPTILAEQRVPIGPTASIARVAAGAFGP